MFTNNKREREREREREKKQTKHDPHHRSCHVVVPVAPVIIMTSVVPAHRVSDQRRRHKEKKGPQNRKDEALEEVKKSIVSLCLR